MMRPRTRRRVTIRVSHPHGVPPADLVEAGMLRIRNPRNVDVRVARAPDPLTRPVRPSRTYQPTGDGY